MEESLRLMDTRESVYSNLEFEVTCLLEEAADLSEVGPDLLRTICESLGWVLGEIWLLDSDAKMFRRSLMWHADDKGIEEFASVTEGISAKMDRGLPGRMLASGRPVSVPDLLAEADFVRKDGAVQARLCAGMGFLLTNDGETVGAVVLLGREPAILDDRLEATLSAIGKSIGQLAAVNLALQRTPAYYRAIVENQCDIVALIGLDGTIHYENAAVKQVLGYGRHERIGKNVFDFIHPDDLAGALRAFQAGLANPGSLQVLTVRARHKNGSWTLLETTGRVMVDVAGTQVAIANSRDIGDRPGQDARPKIADGLKMTERQLTVLRLAGKGMTNKKIAHELDLSPYTIKDNLQSAMRKLSCRTRTEAVLAATKRGLL